MQVGVGEAAEVFKVCSQDSSAASVGEQIADIPVPRGRGRLGGGSLQWPGGFLQDRIQQRLCRC